MSGVRVALRIARRDAARAKGRSALVVAMVGVPMFAIAFAGVAVRTAQVPPAELVRRQLGGADLVAEQVSSRPITQHDVQGYSDTGDGIPIQDQAGRRDLDLRPALPAGSKVAVRRFYYAVSVAANDRVVGGQLEISDLTDPALAGLVRLREGAFPRAADEAAVSTRAARTLGVGLGDTVTVGGTARFRVSGVVVVPNELSAHELFVTPAATLPASLGKDDLVARRYSVTLPPGVSDVSVVPALNRLGLLVRTRTWLLDPPPTPGGGVSADATEIGVVVVVVGLAALEIMLLAGTAFAVGARRRRRELGLLAATGGDRTDVRRVVLAGAAVLGAVAGLLAVAGAVLAVFLTRPLLDGVAGTLLGPLDVRPLELSAVVLLGAGTALLAALLPARAAARHPVVDALTGRRRDARVTRRVPVVALAAIVAGAALAFWAAGDVESRVLADGSSISTGRRANYLLVLVGASVAELGFVGCAPALVTAVGALAKRLPLALRLAARDAARHRTRSGPAVAAVVAAVAGSVAISVYVASDTERQRRDYEPFHVAGGVRISRTGPTGEVAQADVDAAVARLPVRERIDTYDIAGECTVGAACDSFTVVPPDRPRCVEKADCAGRPMRFGLAVAGPPSLVEWTTGRPDARAEQAMRDGSAVVFDERYLRDGKIVLLRERYADGRLVEESHVAVPAVALPADQFTDTPSVVLTPDTARRYGLPVRAGQVLVLTSRVPTEREEAAARSALSRHEAYADIYVERGFRAQSDLTILVLAFAAGLVTLAATGIATGLAAADSRPDLATLAAVGASPRIRRRLVMAQAATVAALGSALGLLAGLVPAVAVVGARADYPLTLPWGAFGISAVAVPMFAALLVGAFTRSRLPLERRVA